MNVEAAAHGLKLIGVGRNRRYRTYQFVGCGHRQEITISHVRIGNFKCQTCQDLKLRNEAAAHGAKIVGPSSRGGHYSCRTYELTCGHRQEIQTGDVRSGEFKCQTCQDSKLRDEAAVYGAKIVGPSRNRMYRTYQFIACGHDQEIQTTNMRIGNFKCRTCNDSHWNGAGHVYLFRLEHPTVGSAIKVGLAKSIDSRAVGICPRDGVTVSVAAQYRFDSYREAHEYEQHIHRAAKAHGWHLSALRAHDFVSNGHTELMVPAVVDAIAAVL